MDKKTGGGDFVKALRKNVPPIEQLYEIKENTDNIRHDTEKIISMYQPIIQPMTRHLINIPCNSAKLYKKAICAPSDLITKRLNKKSIAHKILNLPCYTADIGKDKICEAPHMLTKSVDKLKNVVHHGGARYRNHYYNSIYDPVSRKYYHILSKRGQAIIMGYLGKIMSEI